jgi:hypothetical protein
MFPIACESLQVEASRVLSYQTQRLEVLGLNYSLEVVSQTRPQDVR